MTFIIPNTQTYNKFTILHVRRHCHSNQCVIVSSMKFRRKTKAKKKISFQPENSLVTQYRTTYQNKCRYVFFFVHICRSYKMYAIQASFNLCRRCWLYRQKIHSIRYFFTFIFQYETVNGKIEKNVPFRSRMNRTKYPNEAPKRKKVRKIRLNGKTE